MRPNADFFNVSDAPANAYAGGGGSAAGMPSMMAAGHHTSSSFDGIHQRRISSGPPPTVLAANAHNRDRSGGSGGAAAGSSPSIFSSQTLGHVSSAREATHLGVQRQNSQGVGISFDNTHSFLHGGMGTSAPSSPSVPAGGITTGTPGAVSSNVYGSAFEGRTLSGGFASDANTGMTSSGSGSGGGGYLGEEDEPPLLEELGIRPDHIRDKCKLVLNPFSSSASHELCMDEDLAGPLTFALCLGFLLTLQGKIHFGAIYGISVIGILMSYFLLSMMATNSSSAGRDGGSGASPLTPGGSSPVRLTLVISTLGYCLLPDLLLAAFATGHLWMFGRAAGTGVLLTVLCLVTVVWSAWCSMKIFAEAFDLHHARYLILYPALLFYAVFAAITLF